MKHCMLLIGCVLAWTAEGAVHGRKKALREPGSLESRDNIQRLLKDYRSTSGRLLADAFSLEDRGAHEKALKRLAGVSQDDLLAPDAAFFASGIEWKLGESYINRKKYAVAEQKLRSAKTRLIAMRLRYPSLEKHLEWTFRLAEVELALGDCLKKRNQAKESMQVLELALSRLLGEGRLFYLSKDQLSRFLSGCKAALPQERCQSWAYKLQGVFPKNSEGYGVIQAALLPRVSPSFQYVGSTNYRSPDQDWQALESALFDISKKEPQSAMSKLEAFLTDFPNSGQRTRARYWLARLYLEAKKPESKDILDALILESPFSLYGIHAAFFRNTKPEQILQAKVEQHVAIKDPFLDPDDQWILRRALSLMSEGASNLAEPLFKEMKIKSGYSSAFLFTLSLLAAESKSFLKSFQAMNEFLSRDPGKPIAKDWLQLLYPTDWLRTIESEGNKSVPSLLALSLMKQESGFLNQAYSSAGALGLMQLMPATAVDLDPSITGQALLTPKPNIRLGTKYLAQMIDRFQGNISHALAAYNAGPGAVDRWLRERPTQDMMLFIDLIPYKETREYVAAILRNVYWYTLKLEAKSLDSFDAYYRAISPTAAVTPQNGSDTRHRP